VRVHLLLIALDKEHALRVFENRLLRRIFEPMREEVTLDLRKLVRKKIHNLCSSPNITKFIKPRITAGTEHVAHIIDEKKM
jgi:hypothetical protein